MAKCTLFTESMAAWAADAADDAPRFSMTAAPRFCTVSMNAPWSQAVSSITSGTGFPSMRACAKSGNCVAEWLPQIATFVTWRFCTPAFFASCVLARFSSRRVIANHRSAGTSGAFDRAIRQLVLHGLPTTRTRTSAAAWSLIAWPCGLKIPPFTERRSPRSMPALRGIEPTSSAHDAAVERGLEVGGRLDADEQRVRAVLELHHHALERGQCGLDLEQPQHHRLVGTEQLTAGDPVDERVADLARGAGDGDVEGVCSHAGEITRRLPIRPKPTAWSTRSR